MTEEGEDEESFEDVPLRELAVIFFTLSHQHCT